MHIVARLRWLSTHKGNAECAASAEELETEWLKDQTLGPLPVGSAAGRIQEPPHLRGGEGWATRRVNILRDHPNPPFKNCLDCLNPLHTH